MKRKMTKGDEIFSELLSTEDINLELRYLVNIYRAYALINIKSYDKAQKSLLESFRIGDEEPTQELDLSLLETSDFNLKLC